MYLICSNGLSRICKTVFDVMQERTLETEYYLMFFSG